MGEAGAEQRLAMGGGWRDEGRRPRPISTGSLKTLRSLHARPIDLVIHQGSYSLDGMGDLILGSASRLDAFSAYPVPTWRSSRAPGGTTGIPAVGPSRSSRTREGSPQVSCARSG